MIERQTMNSGALEDLGFDPRRLTGDEIVQHLDRRIGQVLEEIQRSDVWKAVTDTSCSPALSREIVKEIYLEIVMYQPDVIEATIATIAQMPRSLPVDLLDEMLHHQVEEFDHGEMALRDYVAMGGDEKYARNRPMSPSAFSIAAMWRMLCHSRDCFAYLGALYPFEGITPVITEKAKEALRAKGMQDDSLGYVEYHSTEDKEHARMLRELIAKVADLYPDARERICYGLEYFLAIYPMPAWNAAMQRATERHLNSVA